jgi:hypothetical protein
MAMTTQEREKDTILLVAMGSVGRLKKSFKR